MKLRSSQTDEASLSALGEEARALLLRHDYVGLADRFGYALAYGRVPSEAIEADFLSAVASPHAVPSGEHLSIAVQYFAPNEVGLFAAVQCRVLVAEGAAVLLDLIVTGTGDEKHINVEDISGVVA